MRGRRIGVDRFIAKPRRKIADAERANTRVPCCKRHAAGKLRQHGRFAYSALPTRVSIFLHFGHSKECNS